MFNGEQEKTIQRVIVVVEKGLVDSVFDVRFRNRDESPSKEGQKVGPQQTFHLSRSAQNMKDPSAKALNGDHRRNKAKIGKRISAVANNFVSTRLSSMTHLCVLE